MTFLFYLFEEWVENNEKYNSNVVNQLCIKITCCKKRKLLLVKLYFHKV